MKVAFDYEIDEIQTNPSTDLNYGYAFSAEDSFVSETNFSYFSAMYQYFRITGVRFEVRGCGPTIIQVQTGQADVANTYYATRLAFSLKDMLSNVSTIPALRSTKYAKISRGGHSQVRFFRPKPALMGQYQTGATFYDIPVQKGTFWIPTSEHGAQVPFYGIHFFHEKTPSQYVYRVFVKIYVQFKNYVAFPQ